MVDELRHAFELVQQQSEAMQRHIAELEVSPELAAELETARAEIAAEDVRDYEVYRNYIAYYR